MIPMLHTKTYACVFITLFTTLWLFLFSVNVFAEESESTNQVTENIINDYFPLKLEPQWWNKFSKVKGRPLALATSQLSDDLKTIESTDEVNALASSIILLLEQYEQKRKYVPPLLADDEVQLKALYRFEDIFEYIKNVEKISSEVQLLDINLGETQNEIEQYKIKITNQKFNYIKNPDRNVKKLKLGLQWIKSQLILALVEIKATKIQSNIKRLQQQNDKLKKRIETAITRLDISIKEKKQAVLSIELLKKKGEQAKIDIEDLTNKELSINLPGSKKQLLSLKILQTTGKLKILETEALINQVIVDTFNLLKIDDLQFRNHAREILKKAYNKIENTEAWISDTEERIQKEGAIVSSPIFENKQETEEVDNDAITRRKLFSDTFDIGTLLDNKVYELSVYADILSSTLNSSSKGSEAIIQDTKMLFGAGVEGFSKWMVKPIFSLSGIPITPSGLFNFLIIIFIGWILSRLFYQTIKKVNNRTNGGMRPASLKTLSRVISFFFMSVAFIIGFSSLGIDITKLALFASALSIGIGFGLQNIVNNFVSGIIILFERSLKVGDYIELANGVRGEILEINIRSTIINTNDNIDIIVPNSEFVNSSVTNWTMRNNYLRMKIPFSVAYDSDKVLVRQTVIEASLKSPYTLNSMESQYPQVRIVNFGESSLEFELVVWIKPEWSNRPGRVKSAYNWSIETTLSDNEIKIPFPQREVRIIDA